MWLGVGIVNLEFTINRNCTSCILHDNDIDQFSINILFLSVYILNACKCHMNKAMVE